MKFEDFLMEQTKGERIKVELQEEVKKLEAELDQETQVNKVLRCALEGPPQPLLSLLLPPQVQTLLAELAMVEEEIVWLERKIDELKMQLYREKKQGKYLQLICNIDDDDLKQRTRSQNYQVLGKIKGHRKASMGSASDILTMSSTGQKKINKDIIMYEIEKPNSLSEELVKCMIGIFLELNHASEDRSSALVVPKLSFSCKSAKTSFNFKSSNIDPYAILPELDGIPSLRDLDIGPYKTFIQITRHTLDVTRFSECLQAIGKLRVLLHKLSNVDLTFLTYKQKLAFWINIYNACIMHAFLEHGLPSTQEKLLALMNKAALNVGGIVLNALAIEHFILRYPCESKYGPMDEKEMLLRHAYGLGYPEPNVTFALCRGSWSSPALRIYTADDVVNELGRARVEYLEASVGITNKRKILVPKLLQWHMRDFADDMESLVEWIYSQLPHSASLKRLIMECLNKETRSSITKMVEVQQYESEFRYLLPL